MSVGDLCRPWTELGAFYTSPVSHEPVSSSPGSEGRLRSRPAVNEWLPRGGGVKAGGGDGRSDMGRTAKKGNLLKLGQSPAVNSLKSGPHSHSCRAPVPSFSGGPAPLSERRAAAGPLPLGLSDGPSRLQTEDESRQRSADAEGPDGQTSEEGRKRKSRSGSPNGPCGVCTARCHIYNVSKECNACMKTYGN